MQKTPRLTMAVGVVFLAALWTSPAALAAGSLAQVKERTVTMTAINEVVCTLKALEDLLLFAWFTDSTGSPGNGNFHVVNITLAGAQIINPSDFSLSIGNDGILNIRRDMLRVVNAKTGQVDTLKPLPLKRGQKFVVTYEDQSQSASSPDEITHIVGWTGGGAKLKCQEFFP